LFRAGATLLDARCNSAVKLEVLVGDGLQCKPATILPAMLHDPLAVCGVADYALKAGSYRVHIERVDEAGAIGRNFRH
jgi:hypothetical protein